MTTKHIAKYLTFLYECTISFLLVLTLVSVISNKVNRSSENFFLWIPEYENFLVESGILGFGIRNTT